ncbi:DnaJ domain-containing protein [Ureibacillus sp. NPDC094379]
MGLIRGIFSCLIFWKYYFEEDSYERDLKLQDINPFLISSNAFLFIVIVGFINLTIPETAVGGLLTFSFIILIIGHFLFQGWTGDQAIKRNLKRELGIESFREFLKENLSFLKDISVLFSASLIYKFASILDEFFSDYQEQVHYEERYQKDTSYNNSQDNSNYRYNQDKTTKVERIFEKYNLPPNSDEKTIHKSFRTLAKQYHPDMPNGDEKKFIELKEDIEFLMNFIKQNRSDNPWN